MGGLVRRLDAAEGARAAFGINLGTDLIPHLGDKFCLYQSPTEGLSVFGTVACFSVKDAEVYPQFGKAMGGSSYPTVFIWGTVGTGKRGIYRSTDAGANWVRVNDDAHQFGGPGNGEFIAGDMNTEGRVYMGTVGRGLIYGTPAGGMLQARHSSKCLDVPGASTGSGTALVQWTCSGNGNQQWTFEDAGGG